LGALEGNPSGRNYEVFLIGNQLLWKPDSSDSPDEVPWSFLIEATFATGPFLRVSSPFNETKGEGCYGIGESAEISTVASVIKGPNEMYTFEGWSGDYSGNSTVAKLQITKYVTSVKANYKTSYRVNFTSQFGPLQGDGWYESGTTIQLTPPERLWFIFLFDKIEGTLPGSTSTPNNTMSLTVDQPYSFVAVYRLDVESIAILDAVGIGVGLVVWWLVRRIRRRNLPRPLWEE